MRLKLKVQEYYTKSKRNKEKIQAKTKSKRNKEKIQAKTKTKTIIRQHKYDGNPKTNSNREITS